MRDKYCTSILKSQLEKLIDDDYVLLDLPYFGNVGDVLIWQASLDLLNTLPHRCLYSASAETYIRPIISPNVVIVFMGGGNFGDLWERHQHFRHRVMTDFPLNPIVQLPQSVCWLSTDKMVDDVRIFGDHKGKISICLRDQQSYDIITSNYHNVKPYLLPDMVLGLDIDHLLNQWKVFQQSVSENLYVRRTDSEVNRISETDKLVPSDAVIADWPSMKGDFTPLRYYYLLKRELVMFKSKLTMGILDIIFKQYLKDRILRSGVKFISPHKNVYTTRLHCGILAYLMGKNVVMFDNSYGKISGVYDLWMKNQPNVSMQ